MTVEGYTLTICKQLPKEHYAFSNAKKKDLFFIQGESSMKVKAGLFIGELSRQVDIPAQTIRYYERLGLLDLPKRTESQYRLYSEKDEVRLRFIQKAKLFGLSLDEIKTLIDIRAGGAPPCTDLKVMVEQHLEELDRRIEEMLAFREELHSRYKQIKALLPDTSTPPIETICNGEICRLIEQKHN